jgi:2-polyprenyl-6-methoxyphenol hydroxylase-like FAD-dependent oxidoreductase
VHRADRARPVVGGVVEALEEVRQADPGQRSLVFGDESWYRGDLGYYVSIFTVPNHLGLDHAGRFHNEPNRTICVYSARDNAEAKALFWFGSEPLDYDHRDAGQQRGIVAEAFAGTGWETSTLLKRMREAPDFYFDSASQIKLDTYSNGRIALVGDAAYCAAPLSGMGTSLAIVGAYVLAGELAAVTTRRRSPPTTTRCASSSPCARNWGRATGSGSCRRPVRGSGCATSTCGCCRTCRGAR